jgi:DNA primase
VSFDVIADIKDRLPLVEYIQRAGVPLKREGSTWSAPCPFHSEKTGSFKVWDKTNTWKCFGCGKGGDIFHYYQFENGGDFKEAMRALAREAGIELRQSPEQQAETKRLRERAEVLSAAVDHYHSLLEPRHREYLRSRGWTDEFIDSFKFGFAPGGTLRAAVKADVATLQEIGLVNERGRDFFFRRLMIPVYGRDLTAVINLVGRRWCEPGEEDSGPWKYLRLPGEEQLINEGALRGAKFVYLTEGDTDTPTLMQAGLPVVGVPGSKALKDEFAERFARVETIYVCADGDHAGDGLVARAGQLFGSRCRVVELPAGLDINDYVGKRGQDITQLAAEARTYLDWLVSRLPEKLKPDEADRALQPILSALARFGKSSQDLYAKQLSKRFGISVASLREAMREQVQPNGHDKDGEVKLASSRIIWKMPSLVNPAQDYVDGVMLTTVFLDSIVEDPETKVPKVETSAFCVTSAREAFPLTPEEAWKRGWRFEKSKVPANGIIGRRWSTDESAPHSVKAYLDSKVTVCPWDVHREVVGVLRRFVEYPSDYYYDFIALWIEATYWFNLYSAFPYLHLLGFKRTGKSRTLQIIDQLAFNAVWSASMSAAAAYRTVESCSATLLMDEAENLQKRPKDSKDSGKDDDKLEILKAGYQKGQKAIRCAGEDNEPKGYDLYSPKAFGGTQALDRILGDRVIPLVLVRRDSENELDEFALADLQPTFARLRDKIYIQMLDYGQNVAEEIRGGIRWKGVKDRERELWTPILTIAQFIDKARLEDEADPMAIDRATLLTNRMRAFAEIKVAERIAKEQSEQSEVILIEAIIKFTKTRSWVNAKAKHTYSSSALLEFVKQVDGLHWIDSAQKLIGQMEKMALVRDRKRDMPRVHTSTSSATSPVIRGIVLDPDALHDLAQRYGANENPDEIGGSGDGDDE